MESKDSNISRKDILIVNCLQMLITKNESYASSDRKVHPRCGITFVHGIQTKIVLQSAARVYALVCFQQQLGCTLMQHFKTSFCIVYSGLYASRSVLSY